MKFRILIFFSVSALLFLSLPAAVAAQKNKKQNEARPVTIPISIFTKQELRDNQLEEFVQADRLQVFEDSDDQTILSIRSVSNTPLELAILIQDDLVDNINLQLKDIAEFIRKLPSGSRVMVGYIRGGSLQIRQKFTEDLEKAAKSLRIVVGNSVVSPSNPYDSVEDALKRFDALPNGRRAIILISDGLDASRGFDVPVPSQSIPLDSAITKAQRRSVAVYPIYSAGTKTSGSNSQVVSFGQGALQRIADETGGRAFFQGLSSPVSFEPFLKDTSLLLNRQFALTYLSTHSKKGFHKVKVTSTNPDVKIEYPDGYYYRGN